ncbi:MAG: hypothetical protein QOK05_957 [Chloroflexota bacterium]|nr:hypothetical protein [Chloroflexota bacterium]
MSETVFHEVVERMAADPGFASSVAADPLAALGGFDLSPDERTTLAALTSDASAGASALGTRQSKSAMLPTSFLGAAHHPGLHAETPATHNDFGHHATGLHQHATPVVGPHAASTNLHPGAATHPSVSLDHRSDSLSEQGESESLKLQMAMDRLSKFEAALTNIEQKSAETQSDIIQNMK